MNTNIGETLVLSLNRGFLAAATFIPNLIAGIVLLLIGFIVASFIRRLVLEVFRALNVESVLNKYGVPEGKKEFSWTNILAELVRWFVIILFLIPTADVWGLPQIVTVLNTFLLYLPNVFVAAIIMLVGFVFARLAHDIILGSMKGIFEDVSQTVATIARWAIVIFVILAVLNQLGVAQDLIRILFTGFVAMIALAGGIAFGLGGQDTARTLLDSFRRKLKV